MAPGSAADQSARVATGRSAASGAKASRPRPSAWGMVTAAADRAAAGTCEPARRARKLRLELLIAPSSHCRAGVATVAMRGGYRVLAEKVSQDLTLPDCQPVVNQRWRCALLPCVKLSGTTARPAERCSVSSPILAAAFIADSMSPGSI